MEMESLKNLKSAVEKNLEELSKKQDLTPSETKAALDGFELREWILCEMDNCRMEEDYSERSRYHRGYSGEPMDRPYRRYDITAYGNENWLHDMNGHTMRRSYCDQDYYNRGYSRHSIGDRVVEKLENMMDQADSEYEREELRKFMKMIRQAAD